MSIIKELKDMQKHKTVDDVIKSIFYYSKKDEMDKDSSVIHKKFFRLKNNHNYTKLLEDLSFDQSGITPFSDKLDQILFRLELSGKLGSINPAYDKYTIRKEQLAKSVEKFSADEKYLLKQMGEDF